MKRLIVNADDFGGSASINRAVVRAHREGILTSASLMVNGDAFEEAVEIAREHPKLGVGLHLTLVMGRSSLHQEMIPDLVDDSGRFSDDPVAAGFQYSFNKQVREQLSREIDAQLHKFRSTGLPLDHVNGHLNIHLHPVVFRMLCERAGRYGIKAMRVTRDLFWLSCVTSRGRWRYRLMHALIFTMLSGLASGELARLGVRRTERVFGLLENGQVTAEYLARLLPRLPDGSSELYSHPSLDAFRAELEALIDPRVCQLVRDEGIQLVRYGEL